MAKLNPEIFKPFFKDRWYDLWKPFLESEDMFNIMNDLKQRGTRNKIVFPYSKLLKQKCPNWQSDNIIFRAFTETRFESLKVIFIGLSPYSNIENGLPVSDGLAFSTKQKQCPPSLKVLYNAIEKDLLRGIDLPMHRSPDLTFWAEQGVLLLNAALTCEPQLPTIHLELWKPFMTYFIKNIVNEVCDKLHIVFWGEEAQKYAKLVNPIKPNSFAFNNHHYIYLENHPAYYARANSEMDTKVFSTINQRILDSNGIASSIHWDKSTYDDLIPF